MRISCDIEFQDKVVCILGGGSVALRKARQFSKAGAKVYVYAKNYKEELAPFSIDKESFDTMAAQAFLRIAATDDPKINQAFLKEAPALSMCAQKECGQNTFSMVQEETQNIKLAINTKGAFPKACRVLLKELAPWQKKLELLSTLRPSLDPNCFDELLKCTEDELDFFQRALFAKKGLLIFLHGSKDPEAQILLQKRQKDIETRFSLPTLCIPLAGQQKTWKKPVFKAFPISLYSLSLFESKGSYAKKVQEINQEYQLRSLPFSYSYEDYAPKEKLCTHTQPNTDPNCTLVSLLPSTFLDKRHPHKNRIVLLKEPLFLERIDHVLEHITD